MCYEKEAMAERQENSAFLRHALEAVSFHIPTAQENKKSGTHDGIITSLLKEVGYSLFADCSSNK